MIEFNKPYEYQGKLPQEIRDDFFEMSEGNELYVLRALANQLSTDKLGEFIDNHAMGRV
tara:strand:- start:4718 stop:4894 length:177 start_codon:yes stop_codon:yes gene_type:complete